MMNRLQNRCSASMLTSSVMLCSMRPQVQMFRLVYGILSILGSAHDPRSLKLRVIPSCIFVQHESPNREVTQGGI